ncbi:MAG: hypothetical protein KKA07_05545 [Bacteroidetes bacterium]|nr:hypothetical protein [Bacteroidota bacterium]MBU1718518.1 hypothetical protein [Bacteroidota bacterium]
MKSTIRSLTLILAAVFILSESRLCYAQTKKDDPEKKKIELLHAEELMFDRDISPDFRILRGDVQFKHNKTLLFCDTAFLYQDENRVEAFGHIHITEEGDSLNVYAKKLYYDGDSRLAELHDSVFLYDKGMTLTTEHLEYEMKEKVASYYEGGKIVDSANTLTSVRGYYYSEERLLFFKDSVILVNIDYTMYSDTLKYLTETEVAHFFGPTKILAKENTILCRNGWYDTKKEKCQFNHQASLNNKEKTLAGDSLFYDRGIGFGKAIGNISFTDTVHHSVITGQYSEYHEKQDFTLVTDSALFTLAGKKDTFYLHADTLFSVLENRAADSMLMADSTVQDTARLIFAYHHAKFFRKDFQGLCDSMVYNLRDSIFRCFGTPVFWNDTVQLSARMIEAFTGDNRIDSIHLLDSAFVISQKDTIRFDQVKGEIMQGYFRDNEMKCIIVSGYGETIYYLEDEAGALIGVNRADAANLILIMDNSEFKTISFISRPSGTIFPDNQIPDADRRLPAFLWQIERKPTSRYDVFFW